MSKPGKLIDSAAIQAEQGITRGAAEAIMRDLAKTRIGRRVFVKRAEVDEYLEQNTVSADGLRRTA